MTVLEWASVIAVLATWTGVVLGAMRWGHSERRLRDEQREARIMLSVADAKKAIADHAEASRQGQNSLATQVQDIARTMHEGYVTRREFDQTLHTLGAGMTQLGREIGSVGNRVDAVGARIDDIMRHTQWREHS